jgi:hypothetical protein
MYIQHISDRSVKVLFDKVEKEIKFSNFYTYTRTSLFNKNITDIFSPYEISLDKLEGMVDKNTQYKRFLLFYKTVQNKHILTIGGNVFEYNLKTKKGEQFLDITITNIITYLIACRYINIDDNVHTYVVNKSIYDKEPDNFKDFIKLEEVNILQQNIRKIQLNILDEFVTTYRNNSIYALLTSEKYQDGEYRTAYTRMMHKLYDEPKLKSVSFERFELLLQTLVDYLYSFNAQSLKTRMIGVIANDIYKCNNLMSIISAQNRTMALSNSTHNTDIDTEIESTLTAVDLELLQTFTLKVMEYTQIIFRNRDLFIYSDNHEIETTLKSYKDFVSSNDIDNLKAFFHNFEQYGLQSKIEDAKELVNKASKPFQV